MGQGRGCIAAGEKESKQQDANPKRTSLDCVVDQDRHRSTSVAEYT
jgi:hypothetical protein